MLMEDLPGGQASYVVDVYGTLYGIDRLGQPCWRTELVPVDYHSSAFHHAEPDGSFTVVTNSWVNNPSDHSRSVKRMFRVSCTGELISEDELNGNVIVSDRMHMFADGTLVNLPDPYRGPGNGIRLAGQPFDRDQWMHEIKPEAGDTRAASVQDDRLYWLIDHLWELDSNGRFRSLSGSGCLNWDISESGVRLLAYPDSSPLQRMGMPEELCMPEALKMHCRVPGRLFPVVRRFRADLANQRDIKLAASNELMLFGNNISTTPFKCKVNCSILKK